MFSEQKNEFLFLKLSEGMTFLVPLLSAENISHVMAYDRNQESKSIGNEKFIC